MKFGNSKMEQKRKIWMRSLTWVASLALAIPALPQGQQQPAGQAPTIKESLAAMARADAAR